MIDENQLTDGSICPSCAARLTGPRCSACGIDLSGELGIRLWSVSTRAADLLAQRRRILATLRASARTSMSVMAGPGLAPPPAAQAVLPHQAGTDANLLPPLPAPVRPESAPRSVQDVLLGLGALLLAVAGVVFVAVSWGTMGIGGRSAILGGFTALVITIAALAHRRGLPATAEAVGALAVLLALADAYGLGALGAIDSELGGLAYWTGATGLIAAACGAGAVFLPLVSLRVSGAALAQVSGWLLAAYVGSRTDGPTGAAATLVLVVGALVLARILLRGEATDARIVVTAGQLVAVPGALALGTWAVYDASTPVSGATVVLVALALTAGLAARLAETQAAAFCWSASAATAVLVVLIRPQEDLVGADAAAAVVGTVAGVLCLLLATERAVAGRQGRLRLAEVAATVAVGGLFAGGALSTVADLVLSSLFGPFAWIAQPWKEPSSVATADVASLLELAAFGSGWQASAAIAFVALSAAELAGAALLRRTTLGVALALPTLALALHLELLALSPALAVVLAVELAVGLLLCIAAALGQHVGDRTGSAGADSEVRLVQVVAPATGLALLAGTTAWSLVAAAVTLVVLPVVIAVLGTTAVLCARSGRQPLMQLQLRWSAGEIAGATAAVCAVVLVGVELVAGVEWQRGGDAASGAVLAVGAAVAMAAAQLTPLHQSGARILSVVPVTGVALAAAGLALMASAAASAQSLTWILGALALGALAAATARRGVLREAWAALAVALIVATSTAAATWAGAEAATAGLVAVLAAGLLLATAPLARRRGVPLPATAAPVIELVAGAALATGVAVAALDSDVLWIALVAAGVATAAVAARSDRHRVGWLSGVLMVLSTWVRLADSGVETPEAYTAPAAVALLVFGWFRRRRNPETASWTAYGGGLVLLLVPSFLRGLADADGPRPLLLAAVALTVVLVGGWRRLQAPLVVGGAVLALHALVQLGPAIAFSPLPKWVSLGAVGLLLLTLGATYERRIAEVRRLAGVISRMD